MTGPLTKPPRRRDVAIGRNGLRFRAAEADDLHACWGVWRDALNDYLVRLNQPPIPAEAGSVVRLHEHLRSTDPDGFVVATRQSDDGTERVVGFTSAVRRDHLWFLSMLFVRPGEQGAGVGRALLAQVLPRDDATLATATDTAQPISNALYASLGMVPRMPLFSLVGRPERDGGFGSLPGGVKAIPFDEAPPGLDRDPELGGILADLDADALGVRHPQDHRYAELEGRRGFIYRGPDGAVLGYGYTSEVGRVGPVAVRDETLLPAVVGHLVEVIEPRGASAIWIPGAADRAMIPLLRAGFRLEGFPVLLCWNRPFADFARYLPISPGLL